MTIDVDHITPVDGKIRERVSKESVDQGRNVPKAVKKKSGGFCCFGRKIEEEVDEDKKLRTEMGPQATLQTTDIRSTRFTNPLGSSTLGSPSNLDIQKSPKLLPQLDSKVREEDEESSSQEELLLGGENVKQKGVLATGAGDEDTEATSPRGAKESVSSLEKLVSGRPESQKEDDALINPEASLPFKKEVSSSSKNSKSSKASKAQSNSEAAADTLDGADKSIDPSKMNTTLFSSIQDTEIPVDPPITFVPKTDISLTSDLLRVSEVPGLGGLSMSTSIGRSYSKDPRQSNTRQSRHSRRSRKSIGSNRGTRGEIVNWDKPEVEGPIDIEILNGAYRTFSSFSVMKGLYIDDKGKKWINVRWPRETLHAVFNLRALILQNNIKPEQWVGTPIKDLNDKYEFTDAMGKNKLFSIGALFAMILGTVPEKYKIWWLNNNDWAVFSPTGHKMRQWLEPQFQLFREHEKITNKERRTIFDRSLEPVTNIIFCILQSINLLLSDECDENVKDYASRGHGPTLPDIVNLNFTLSSSNQYLTSCNWHADFWGKAKEIWPFSIKATSPSNPHMIHMESDAILKSSTGNDTSNGFFTEEQWSKFPSGVYIKIQMIPEAGSTMKNKIPDEMLSVWCHKPKDGFIDFLNKKEFPDSEVINGSGIMFAKTFGDGKGLHHHYKTPLHVRVEPEHHILITNKISEKSYIIPLQECYDVAQYIFDHSEDGSRGWANLQYYGGENIDENGKYVNPKIYDTFEFTFYVSQVPAKKEN